MLLNIFYLRIVMDMYRKEPFSIGRLFLWFFSLRVIIAFLQIFGLILFPEREMLSDTVALGGILTGFLGILILESYWSDTYNPKRLTLGAVLGTLTVTFMLLARTGPIGEALKAVFPFFIQVSVPIFFFFVGFNVFLLIRRMLPYANTEQRRSLLLILAYFIVVYIGVPLHVMVSLLLTTHSQEPLPEFTPENFFIFSVIPNLIYLLTDPLWYPALFRHRSFGFLQIRRIDWLVIATANGTALYEYSPSGQRPVEENLFSSALVAMHSVLAEITQIQGNLKMIQVGDFYIMIRQTIDLSVVIFTKHPTRYLEEATSAILQMASISLDPDSIVVQHDLIDQMVRSIIYY